MYVCMYALLRIAMGFSNPRIDMNGLCQLCMHKKTVHMCYRNVILSPAASCCSTTLLHVMQTPKVFTSNKTVFYS